MSAPPTLLIVEDEVIVAAFLQYYLTGHGFYVPETTTTGEAAVKVARKISPDIVLMDIQLAGKMSGIEAAEEISGFSSPAFLLLTAHAQQFQHYIVSGCKTSVMEKPFDEIALLERLRTLAGLKDQKAG